MYMYLRKLFCILTLVGSSKKVTYFKIIIQQGIIIDKIRSVSIVSCFDVIIFAIYKQYFKHK